MSYDLIVFDAEKVPEETKSFLRWFAARKETGEDDDYRSPKACTDVLKRYFEELTSYFPWMDEVDEERATSDSHCTDYGFGHYLIHCSFAWSLSRKAYITVLTIAQRHPVGVYDISSGDVVLFPTEIPAHIKAGRKPWWKFW